MFQYQQNLLTKQFGTPSFKILILDEQSYSLARALLPYDWLQRLSICAISDLRTNLSDLTSVAELVFVLHPDSLGALVQFLGAVVKYFKITVVFTGYLPDMGYKSEELQHPPQFRAFYTHFVTFLTPYLSIAPFDVFSLASLDYSHSTGFSSVYIVGKDHYAANVVEGGSELMVFDSYLYYANLVEVDAGAAQTPKLCGSLLFNKFRTFLTYGGLAFEFFELIEGYSEEITERLIGTHIPGPRDYFFYLLQEDALFYQYSRLPLQDAIAKNLEVVKEYKNAKERLYKTQNLAEIAELDRRKLQIDRSSTWLKRLLDICKVLGLYQVKDLEDDILSGPYGLDLAKQKISALPEYCYRKMRLLYYLSYGKPLASRAKCAAVVESGGLLKGSKRCAVESLVDGVRYRQFDYYYKGVSAGQHERFVYFDGEMVFGELCYLGYQIQAGCTGCKPWQHFAAMIE